MGFFFCRICRRTGNFLFVSFYSKSITAPNRQPSERRCEEVKLRSNLSALNKPTYKIHPSVIARMTTVRRTTWQSIPSFHQNPPPPPFKKGGNLGKSSFEKGGNIPFRGTEEGNFSLSKYDSTMMIMMMMSKMKMMSDHPVFCKPSVVLIYHICWNESNF